MTTCVSRERTFGQGTPHTLAHSRAAERRRTPSSLIHLTQPQAGSRFVKVSIEPIQHSSSTRARKHVYRGVTNAIQRHPHITCDTRRWDKTCQCHLHTRARTTKRHRGPPVGVEGGGANVTVHHAHSRKCSPSQHLQSLRQRQGDLVAGQNRLCMYTYILRSDLFVIVEPL